MRAAVRNSGLVFPGKRITVNLAPADIRKAGPSYDLPIAALAHQQSISHLFVPAADAPEAALIDGLEVIPVEHLSEAAHLQELREIPPYDADLDPSSLPPPAYAADFAEIKGQEHVKRALVRAAMQQIQMGARAFRGTLSEFPASSSWRGRSGTWRAASASRRSNLRRWLRTSLAEAIQYRPRRTV